MAVADAFTQFLARLELDEFYDDVVSDRHDAVRRYVERRIPGVRTQLIGSLQRRTRIDPLQGLTGFDIDILAELGSFYSWMPPGQGVTCDTALAAVEDTIRGNLIYRRMDVHDDSPAIVIPYSDGSKVEVVPAYRNQIPGTAGIARAYWVPRSGHWRAADYDYDADWISGSNVEAGGRLVPMIKMLKAWRREHCAEMRSYHLEVLAATAVTPAVAAARREHRYIPWQVLAFVAFAKMTDLANTAVVVPGTASEPADNYLTPTSRAGIVAAIRATAELAALANNLAVQSESQSLQVWRTVFGAPFPA